MTDQMSRRAPCSRANDHRLIDREPSGCRRPREGWKTLDLKTQLSPSRSAASSSISSSHFAQTHVRKLAVARFSRHDKLELLHAQGHLTPGRSPGGVALTHLVLRPFNFRLLALQFFSGSRSLKRLMRPLGVVLSRVGLQSILHHALAQPFDVDAPEKLALDAQPQLSLIFGYRGRQSTSAARGVATSCLPPAT